jgi:hypothetical protein
VWILVSGSEQSHTIYKMLSSQLTKASFGFKLGLRVRGRVDKWRLKKLAGSVKSNLVMRFHDRLTNRISFVLLRPTYHVAVRPFALI